MSDFTSCGSFSPSSFASSTLILPAVSLGNVPQLTADLLIFSLGLKRVGFVGKGDTVAPFAGRGEKGGEIVTGGIEVYGQEGSELQLQKIQNIPPLSLGLSQPATSVQNITSSYPPFLPAAGLTRRLLTALSEEKTPIPHGAIAAWCVEGDNRGDSRSFADVVLYVLDLQDVVQIQEPASWEGLFGTTEGWSGGSGADAELYG
ncbi:hypothetical protein D1P53_000659 [Cryptococcus gattii VGV]|nr:hypothetical protein D1P53_000659 [Cryptococcus gattii VGV]